MNRPVYGGLKDIEHSCFTSSLTNLDTQFRPRMSTCLGTRKKVTAQRKFAQGAYIPPTCQATVAPASERRELPSPDAVTCRPCMLQPRWLLDLVAFQNTHTHRSPVVVVERCNEKIPRRMSRIHVHGMQLRNNYERGDTNYLRATGGRLPLRRKQSSLTQLSLSQKPSKQSDQSNTTSPIPGPSNIRSPKSAPALKSSTPRVFSKSRNIRSTRQNSTNRLPPRLSNTKSPEPVPSNIRSTKSGPTKKLPNTAGPLSWKRRQSNRAHLGMIPVNQTSTELDSSAITTPILGPVNTSTPKPRNISASAPNLINITIPESTPSNVNFRKPPTKSVGSKSQSNKTSIQDRPTKRRRTVSEFSTEDNKPLTYFANNRVCAETRAVTRKRPPIIFESGSESDTNISPDRRLVRTNEPTHQNYYSDRAICTWMAGYIAASVLPATCNTPSANEPQPSTSAGHSSVVCPIIACRSLDTLTNEQLAARCTRCRSCSIVDKLKTISDFTRKQGLIDCFDENSANNDYFAIELVPPNKSLMIKIKVIQSHMTVYNTYLIPRHEALPTLEFDFDAHEGILDQLIETSALSSGEGPSNLVQRKGAGKSITLDTMNGSSCFSALMNNDGTTEVPVFWPTPEEFIDPLGFIEKIWDQGKFYGICKIVPPETFETSCKVDDTVRFEVRKQYVTRFFDRWGPAAQERCAIIACLKAENKLSLSQILPLYDGVEMDLTKLYRAVKKNGGIQEVINNELWYKVGEELKLTRNPAIDRKLAGLYLRYLISYESLTIEQREGYINRVQKAWMRKSSEWLKRADNPLHNRKVLMGDSESSEEESDSDGDVKDLEVCTKPGGIMNLAKFKKVARSTYDVFFGTEAVNAKQIEEDYWNRVKFGNEHICVYTASIDTGAAGYGFPRTKNDPDSKSPWNLKMLNKNPANILRSLKSVLGVTTTALNLGMVYSTGSWHKDPQGLPWIEYLHQGPTKVWYAIPESHNAKFREATKLLDPTVCQNKSLWLSNDISMVPPSSLKENGVNVYRLEQNQGEFVVVMPKAYTCTIATGYTVSESTYYASEQYLDDLIATYKETRDCSEPTTFSLEQLLKSLIEDKRTKISVLRKIEPVAIARFCGEMRDRALLLEKGVVLKTAMNTRNPKGRRTRQQPSTSTASTSTECHICRCMLYLTKVCNISSLRPLCAEHALIVLGKPKYSNIDISTVEMELMFEDTLIQSLLYKLNQRIQQNA